MSADHYQIDSMLIDPVLHRVFHGSFRDQRLERVAVPLYEVFQLCKIRVLYLGREVIDSASFQISCRHRAVNVSGKEPGVMMPGKCQSVHQSCSGRIAEISQEQDVLEGNTGRAFKS